MQDFKDIATTCIQLLSNAAGAEFEDEELAVEIIAETIKRTNANDDAVFNEQIKHIRHFDNAVRNRSKGLSHIDQPLDSI